MEASLTKPTGGAWIGTQNNIIHQASNGFMQLTGYRQSDIVGKSLVDLNILLRNGFQMPIQDIEKAYNLYIFKKDTLPVEVEISCKRLEDENNKIYYFDKKEEPFLKWILYNFDNMDINENESTAIFSYSGRILLKHNKSYIRTLPLMGIVSDHSIGRYALFPDKLSKLFEQKTSLHKCEVECISLKKVITYWDINIKIIREDRGKKYYIASFYDVTQKVYERKQIEKQKKEMSLILDNMSDTVNIINKKGEYTYINEAGKEKLAPYIADPMVANNKMIYNLFDFFDINGQKILFDNIPGQRVLRGEKIEDCIIIGANHLPITYHQCNGTPVYDELGNVEGGILIYKDIESIYKAEEYSALKENIKDISIFYALLSYDDFKIKYVNEYVINSMRSVDLNINSELDVIGKSLFDFYMPEEEDFIENIMKSANNHTAYVHKHHFMNKGQINCTKILFQPIYDQNDQVEGIIAIGLDISDEAIERKQMEKVLNAQEEMFVNVSHELKTPLNLIFSAAQLSSVSLEQESMEDIRKDFKYSNKIIKENCYRLTRLINNILDISKIESGFYKLNLFDYNIVDVLDDIIESVTNHIQCKGLEIIFDTKVEDLIIALDIHKFERVLLNLISNAIKFSNGNGVILINLIERNNTMEISVQDSGIGINEQELDSIFQKFVQLNTSLNRVSEGTGIGLSLVKYIVEHHGGNIRVESTLGEGSIFTVELPLITVGKTNLNPNKHYEKDKTEMIKFELSDTYF